MARPFGRVVSEAQVQFLESLTSHFEGETATLPGPQAATRLYSSKVTDRRSLQPFTFQPVTLGLRHTTWDRPVWEASFPETGAQRSSRWQALAHREQAILARDRMAHQSVFPGPDYQIGPN